MIHHLFKSPMVDHSDYIKRNPDETLILHDHPHNDPCNEKCKTYPKGRLEPAKAS
jgi:hypothetical protein